MLTAFWSSISGKLADRFAALSAPALVFWLGGLLAWSAGHGGIHVLSGPAGWLAGKSAFTLWPWLWLVLPDTTRQELAAASASCGRG